MGGGWGPWERIMERKSGRGFKGLKQGEGEDRGSESESECER